MIYVLAATVGVRNETEHAYRPGVRLSSTNDCRPGITLISWRPASWKPVRWDR